MQPAPTATPSTSAPRRKHPWKAVAVVAIVAVALVGGLYYMGFLGGGTLRLMVHDAPCTGCTHVWVTFTGVWVHESDVKGSGWTEVNTTGATFDLMALNGTSAAKLFGIATLPAGHYQDLRLDVSKVMVNLTGGAWMWAQVIAPQSNFPGQFTISTMGTTTLNIDVDLGTSVHVTGASATFTPNIGGIQTSGP